MKVLQVNSVYEYSSTGRTTKELHEFLLEKGVDAYVAAMNITEPNERLIKIGGNLSWKTHSLLSHLTGRQGYYSHLATKKLLHKISTIAPDIVHLRNLHSNFINLSMLLHYLAKNNIATVLTLHDFWFLTGHCCYFTDSHCDRWKSSCGKCPDIHKWNKSWFFDCSHQNLKQKEQLFSQIKRLAVIGVSDWVTAFVRQSILKEAAIIRTIYNWVDTDIFHPVDASYLRKKHKIKDDDFVVLGVAQNWSSEKGINDFIRLANVCPQYKIVLVGGNSQIIKELPENVFCVGATTDVKELAAYYSMADVFYNPTTRETFGKVTVEAQACGTPVIAYKATATSELISSGCGYVLDDHSIDNVVSCCLAIQKADKDDVSKKCRLSVCKKFAKNILMENYLELYSDVICYKE